MGVSRKILIDNGIIFGGEAFCRHAASPCPNTECAVLSAELSESVLSLMRTASANSPPDAAGLLAKAVLPQDRQRTSVSNNYNIFFINMYSF